MIAKKRADHYFIIADLDMQFHSAHYLVTMEGRRARPASFHTAVVTLLV